MKLSKQERIAAIVVIVLVILVAGVFIFIKPNIETINETNAALDAIKTEYEADLQKQAQKDPLRTQILEAYDKGKNMADMFFPELASYQADNEFRVFLEKCKENGNANVLVEDFSVSSPTTAGLSTSVFIPTEVQYALKDYVNQGNTVDITKNDPRLVRQALIQSSLGDPQTIGATTVSFTLKATTIEDLLAFADEVNNYTKDESGQPVRKAIELNGISFTNNLTEKEYNELAAELTDQAQDAGNALFEKNTGSNAGGSSNNNPGTPNDTPPENGDNNNNDNNNDDQNNGSLDDHFFTMPCTITFYSIERMQDPTDKLNEQDEAATGTPAPATPVEPAE